LQGNLSYGYRYVHARIREAFFSWLLSTTSSFNALKLLHIDHLADAVGKNKSNRRKKIDENKQTVWRKQQQKRIEE